MVAVMVIPFLFYLSCIGASGENLEWILSHWLAVDWYTVVGEDEIGFLLWRRKGSAESFAHCFERLGFVADE
jgi:hypothetical protein